MEKEKCDHCKAVDETVKTYTASMGPDELTVKLCDTCKKLIMTFDTDKQKH